jgi:hypothetical protein
MNRTEIQISSDLQKFIDKFEPSKFKMMAKGIEIRGINDMHRNVSIAKALIEKMKLNLTVTHTADMLAYGGFEVTHL